jgi:3-hydroxyisobutyrate dehydrogenase
MRAGFEVVGCDVSAAVLERFAAEGGLTAATPAKAAAGAGVVVAVVVNAAQTKAVLFGPGGAAEMLDLKPTTLASRIKALGIANARGPAG